MEARLSLRVSWICLLLFSSAMCFPATKGDYRYPYTVTRGSGGAAAPGSNLQPGGSGNLSPSGLGGPSVAAGSSPRYEPNRFIVTYDPSSDKPSGPAVPSQGTSPPGFRAPADPGGSSATVLDFGDGLVPYNAAPAASGFDGPAPYTGLYGNPSGPGWLPWAGEPAEGAGASFYDPSSWMPSRSFPDFGTWDVETPQSVSEAPPLPPSSYIIQSRNGYLRAREVLSHTKYSPEYPEPPVFPYEAAKAPSRSLAAPGPKGGKKA